jgi:hypothetical protein
VPHLLEPYSASQYTFFKLNLQFGGLRLKFTIGKKKLYLIQLTTDLITCLLDRASS